MNIQRTRYLVIASKETNREVAKVFCDDLFNPDDGVCGWGTLTAAQEKANLINNNPDRQKNFPNEKAVVKKVTLDITVEDVEP